MFQIINAKTLDPVGPEFSKLSDTHQALVTLKSSHPKTSYKIKEIIRGYANGWSITKERFV